MHASRVGEVVIGFSDEHAQGRRRSVSQRLTDNSGYDAFLVSDLRNHTVASGSAVNVQLQSNVTDSRYSLDFVIGTAGRCQPSTSLAQNNEPPVDRQSCMDLEDGGSRQDSCSDCSKNERPFIKLSEQIVVGSITLDPHSIAVKLRAMKHAGCNYLSLQKPSWHDLHPFSVLALEQTHMPAWDVTQTHNLRSCHIYTDGSYTEDASS